MILRQAAAYAERFDEMREPRLRDAFVFHAGGEAANIGRGLAGKRADVLARRHDPEKVADVLRMDAPRIRGGMITVIAFRSNYHSRSAYYSPVTTKATASCDGPSGNPVTPPWRNLARSGITRASSFSHRKPSAPTRGRAVAPLLGLSTVSHPAALLPP